MRFISLGIIAIGIISLFGVYFFTQSSSELDVANVQQSSVELGILELSPLGETGGYAMPASGCGVTHQRCVQWVAGKGSDTCLSYENYEHNCSPENQNMGINHHAPGNNAWYDRGESIRFQTRVRNNGPQRFDGDDVMNLRWEVDWNRGDCSNADANWGTNFRSVGGIVDVHTDGSQDRLFNYDRKIWSAGQHCYRYLISRNYSGYTDPNLSNNATGIWRSVRIRPPAPTGLSHTCSADGTSVTLRWTAPSDNLNNYNRFYFRMRNDSTGGTNVHWNDNYAGTSRTVSITPGHQYDWWIHTRGPQAVWSTSVGEFNFRCNPVPYVDLDPNNPSVAGSVSTPARDTSTQNHRFYASIFNRGNRTVNACEFNYRFEIDYGRDGSLDRYFPNTNGSYVRGCDDGASAASIVASDYETFSLGANTSFPVGDHRVRVRVQSSVPSDESNNSNNLSGWTNFSIGSECTDSSDNDADGLVDGADGGCVDNNDNNEGSNPNAFLEVSVDGGSYQNIANTTVVPQDNVRFQWSSNNGADTCVATGDSANWSFSTGGATSGADTSIAVPVSATTDLVSVRCIDNPTTEYGDDTITMTVLDPAPVSAIEIEDESGGTVSSGSIDLELFEVFTLRWDSVFSPTHPRLNPSSHIGCNGSNFVAGSAHSGSRVSDSSGISDVPIGGSVDYWVRCTDTDGDSDDSPVVTVRRPTISVDLTASDELVDIGADTTLSWDTGAITVGVCEIRGSGLPTNPYPLTSSTGSVDATVNGEVTYELVCEGGIGNQGYDNITVRVTGEIFER